MTNSKFVQARRMDEARRSRLVPLSRAAQSINPEKGPALSRMSRSGVTAGPAGFLKQRRDDSRGFVRRLWLTVCQWGATVGRPDNVQRSGRPFAISFIEAGFITLEGSNRNEVIQCHVKPS